MNESQEKIVWVPAYFLTTLNVLTHRHTNTHIYTQTKVSKPLRRILLERALPDTFRLIRECVIKIVVISFSSYSSSASSSFSCSFSYFKNVYTRELCPNTQNMISWFMQDHSLLLERNFQNSGRNYFSSHESEQIWEITQYELFYSFEFLIFA